MADDFKYDVFLSHSAKDKVVVRGVAERLRGDGLRVWFDEWEIRPGDSIPALVEAAIDLDGTVLHCPEGVSVFPDGHPAAPRLPLLGLRAVARNKIKIVIDGMDVTVG